MAEQSKAPQLRRDFNWNWPAALASAAQALAFALVAYTANASAWHFAIGVAFGVAGGVLEAKDARDGVDPLWCVAPVGLFGMQLLVPSLWIDVKVQMSAFACGLAASLLVVFVRQAVRSRSR